MELFFSVRENWSFSAVTIIKQYISKFVHYLHNVHYFQPLSLYTEKRYNFTHLVNNQILFYCGMSAVSDIYSKYLEKFIAIPSD